MASQWTALTGLLSSFDEEMRTLHRRPFWDAGDSMITLCESHVSSASSLPLTNTNNLYIGDNILHINTFFAHLPAYAQTQYSVVPLYC